MGENGDLVLSWFRQRCERAPSDSALVSAGRQLTYEELDRRSNLVARKLGSVGIGSDSVVAIHAPRSFEAIIGVIGVLKAGAAFLPLDPDYPAQRIEFMLRDSRTRLALTLGEPVLGGVDTLSLEDLATGDASYAGVDVSPDNLAYVIYTSGSTGRPKGVMVTHRGLANLARAQILAFQVDASCRVLQFASLSFDAAVSEILIALLSGAALVVAPPSALVPDASLVDTLRDLRITTLTVPPSALAVLPSAELPDLRTIISAGEACSAQLRDQWSKRHRLINAYGPTEATVCATIAEEFGRQAHTTIGRPIDHVRVHVLDGDMRPIDDGGVGEIYLGGVGLARGYLGRPGLTAERFVPDPAGDPPGARLYRTGDLARRLSSGDLEFIGRSDSQIKIRGYRIELGEIECVLREHPRVREVAIIVRERAGGDRRLLAFVTSSDGTHALRDELRRQARAHLPDYMLPIVVTLDRLPLTPTGKIDRAALLAMPIPREPGEPPRDELERQLAALWEAELGVAGIGVTEDFFELGGDSLMAAKVTNQIQGQLGETVYFVALFDHPTIADLAAYLRTHYAPAVARALGATAHPAPAGADPPIESAQVAQLRELMRSVSPYRRSIDAVRRPNPSAVFVLSPPRSGSTLFRVMLAGNPALFVPQELGLLAFARVGEERVLSNGSTWVSQGLLRSLMQIHSWTADEAKAFLRDCEQRRMSTQDAYRHVQERVAPRRLVDKTTTYALDPSILECAEREFEQPFYIHLTRHPCGMIQSFENVRMDRFFFRWADEPLFPVRRLAELVWFICHDNIQSFLAGIPAQRQLRVAYEDVVRDPRRAMETVCDRLAIAYDEAMLEPHADSSERMTDGIHGDRASRQIGDPNFHKHRSIDAAAADAWRSELGRNDIGEITRELAAGLGYA